ncbi:MAG: EAL domain-containing protein, partial [Gammaproteobacteria bacterium]|nr:EAL domain-containing protein [Gammaproteobacteria bacterium]
VLAHAFNELIKFGEDNREMLEEQKQHVEDLLDSTAEAIYGLDLQGCCTFANPACVRMLGLRDAAELVGRNMHDQIHHQRPDGAACTVEECSIFGTLLSGNRNHSDKEMLWRADGSCFPAEYWSYPVHRDGKLAGAVITFLDITERQQQDAQILEQAHFDTLTKLPNRFLALDRMSQMLNDARRNDTQAAVLFLDLDDFKKVNDSLGHDAGDKLLYEAASRLRSRLRLGDTIGRLGGDEFIVLLGGVTDSADVRAVAEDLLKYFWEPFSVDARDLLLTASIGIALFPEDGDTPSELLRNADSAMYHAKEQGRNTYSFFTDAMNRGVSRRLALEEQMHGALGRGEFRLCYQPQIELGSGRIVGVEALLRWHNPALGEISPVEFIPIAEQTGLIMPVGEFVLTEALSMAATWQQEQGQPLRIAVNLSPRQFRDPNLVGFIEQAIHRSGVSANTLELEITEGLLMSGYANIEEDLGALNDLGVGIAMDDFGTGYSSLGYLRNYPFDTMKIDRTFVNEVTANVADMELVRAATAMAHGLGLKVVAEGVETEEQRALLASLGCDFAQGYLFSKPVSPEEISAMLKDRYREQNPPEIRRLIS